ncbi:hypothetical protein L195_g039378 [Trifolium pratense]|uniref:Uncharacterized protein n=1 Tax=Trifolium pratense TaxID=57577 RepID=A0A2K3LXS2_TRIPR|nr:hypothetical protein L195_g039378 [Trifolium pratense]
MLTTEECLGTGMNLKIKDQFEALGLERRQTRIVLDHGTPLPKYTLGRTPARDEMFTPRGGKLNNSPSPRLSSDKFKT